jgi:hypothetical protein
MHESELVEMLEDLHGHPVSKYQILLELTSSQIEESVAELCLLGGLGLSVHGEWQGLRTGQNLSPGGEHFDLAGFHIGVDGIFGSQLDQAFDLYDPLQPDTVIRGRYFGRFFGMHHDLHDTGAISNLQEDQPAEVSSAVDPPL